MEPASRMPRRFPYSMISVTPTVIAMVISVGRSAGNTDDSAAVPADVCTATVTV